MCIFVQSAIIHALRRLIRPQAPPFLRRMSVASALPRKRTRASASSPTSSPPVDDVPTFASFKDEDEDEPLSAAATAATSPLTRRQQDDEEVQVTGAVLRAGGSKRSKAERPILSNFFSAAAASSSAAASSATAAASSVPAAPAAASSSKSSKLWSYHPGVLPSPSDRSRLYDSLRALVNPTPGKIFLYGRECTEHRLTGSFARRAGSFSYSGTEKTMSGEWPAVLQELHEVAARVAAELRDRTGVDLGLPEEERRLTDASAAAATAPAGGASSSSSSSTAAASTAAPPSPPSLPYWDTVLINFYRDGSDCISWHADKDGATSTIASFSLGAEREFLIRARPPYGQAKYVSTKSLESHQLLLGDGSLLLMLPGMQQRYHHSLPPRKAISRGRINVTFRAHGREQSDTPQNVRS